MIFFHISNWPQIDKHNTHLTLWNRCIPSAWPVHAPSTFPVISLWFLAFPTTNLSSLAPARSAPSPRRHTTGSENSLGIIRAMSEAIPLWNLGHPRRLCLDGMCLLDLAMSGSAFLFVSGEWLSSRCLRRLFQLLERFAEGILWLPLIFHARTGWTVSESR